MKLIQLFACIIVFTACKKDNDTYEELYRKADKKLIEIENLIKKSSCGNLGDWQIDTIYGGIQGGNKYFPVSNTIKDEYSQLKASYVALWSAALKADPRPVLDILIAPEVHFEVGCIDGHPKVLLTSDLTLEQVRERLNNSIATLETFYSNSTCNGSDYWYTRPIIKDCTVKHVLFHADENPNNKPSFYTKYREYDALSLMLAQLDPSYAKCMSLTAPLKKVYCENNKPVIK